MRTEYTGLSTLYDLLMDDVDYDLWADRIDSLLRSVYSGTGAVSVMDCACGTGAISIRLAKKGYRVTGTDISSDMLRVAYENALKNGVRIPFVQMDMAELKAMRPVQAINCSCDGVNYLTSMPRVKRFFTCANRALVKEGLLMFDVSTRYKLSEVIGCNTFGEDRRECTYLWMNTYDPAEKLVQMRLAFFTPGKDGSYQRFDETHIQRAHSHTELVNALTGCGFTLEGAYDGITAQPMSETSERVLYVARKSGEI